MKHLFYCCCCFFLFITCTAQQDKQNNKNQDKLNIIVIVADDLGWSDLSSYGNDFIETPNLDSLAAAGVRFTNAYAAASLCSPSRASLITGLNPVRVNITEHTHGNQPAGPHQKLQTPFIDQALKLSFKTIAEALKEEDYATAFIGKWHLGGGQFAPQHQGFDLNIAGGYHGLPKTFYYPFFDIAQKPAIQDSAKEGDYLTDVLTDKALNYISTRKDSAFFLYLAYYSPHVPIEGKNGLVEKYREKRGGQPDSLLPNIHYAAMVESIDQNVGRILKELKQQNINGNTIVIFTSDNGGLYTKEVPAFAKHTPPTTNAPLRAGKGYSYEGGIRVPFIVYWSGKAANGSVSNVPVIGNDLFNTAMDITGSMERTPDGISIVPLLNGKKTSERNLYWHSPHYSPQGGKPNSAIRKGKYKLIEFYEDHRLELYNLENDISEKVNLIDKEKAKAEALYEELEDWKKDIGAKLPVENPGYQGSKKN